MHILNFPFFFSINNTRYSTNNCNSLSWDYCSMHYAICVVGCHGIPFLVCLFTWQIVYPPWYPYIDSTTAAFVLLFSNPLESPWQPYVAINSLNLMLVHLAFACDTLFSWHSWIYPFFRFSLMNSLKAKFFVFINL